MHIQPIILLATVVSLAAMVMAAAPAGAPAAAATAPAQGQRIKIWEQTPAIVAGQDADANPTEPTIDIYLPPQDKATGAAVMVFPGGGYTNLSMTNEGSSIAKMFLSHNVAAFVVRYRHAPRYHYPIPIEDGQRAIRLVRSNAAEYHIDPKRIGVIGFSAGGHLAASLATMYADGPAPETIGGPDAIDKENARPDFAILMYPVINMTDDAVTHKGSRDALTNKDESLFAKLSPEQHVTKEVPPVFLAQGTNDRTVPVMNSILFYEACLKAQVPVELHVFENGPHGFGLGAADPSLKTWPDLAIQWLVRNKILK